MLKRFQPTMKFIRTFTSKAVTLLMCGVLLCACAQNTEDPPITIPGNVGVTETDSPEIKNGGILHVPMSASPSTMHPLYIKEAQMRNLYSMIFEPLVSFNELMEPTQCLAESWKYDASSNTWTIKLRANVHWHGGVGYVTGADAAYTINTVISDPESIFYANLSPYIKSAEGYDNTLIIYPHNPTYALIYALNIPVVPMAYYQDKGKQTMDIPVGSGCFEAKEFTVGAETKMTLNAFPNWWKKLPYIQQVIATGYGSTPDMLEAFKKGDIDCVPTSLMTTETYEILEGVSEKNYLSHNYVFVAFNVKKTVMANVDFRRAIAYGIDRTDIINNVYLTKATGAEQPLFNDTSLSSAKVTRYDHDAIKAKELLFNIGYWDSDGDGYLNTDSGNLEISLAVLNEPANPVRLEAAEYIQADLKEIGIKVNIKALGLAELKKVVEKNDYDMILSGYYLSDTPNLDFVFSLNGSGNLSGYSSDGVNNALAAMKNASTLENLKSATLGLQNTVANELPQIGLFFEMNTFLYSDKLAVGNILRDTSVYSTINTWYFNNI